MPLFGAEGIGLDLGSMQTSIFLTSTNEVSLREPTAVLVSAANMQDVLCVGREARAMMGRTGGEFVLLEPIQQGAVADVEMTALLMVALCEKAIKRKRPMEKAVLVCSLSGGATTVERDALFQAMTATGARRVAAVRSSVAAAIGCDLDISRPRGRLVVSMGHAVTDISVLSMNAVVAQRAVRFGGQNMDEAIVNYLRREKGIVIGLRTAEQLKREIASVSPAGHDADEEPVLLRGKNALTGAPMSMNITSADVSRALERPVEWLLDIIRSAIVNVPGELVADIRDSGIQLCGGGALLEGIDQRLEKETGLAVRMSEHPQDDVVVGLGALASNDRLLNTLIRNGAAEGTVE